MIRSTAIAAALAIHALPGQAQDVTRGPSWVNLTGTQIELRPTTKPGAVAEVYIFNRKNNSYRDNGSHDLTLGSVAATITFEWNAAGSKDGVSVESPLIAVPPEMHVDESGEGRIYLYDRTAPGM